MSLSEQQLVDCSAKYRNHGCFGGWPYQAFQYIRDNHGLDTEKSYPYDSYGGMKDDCHFNKSSVGATDKGFVSIPKGDEDALAMAVAAHGPISVALDASSYSFEFYDHGIYSGCDEGHELNHAVLVVGYAPGYWIIKNSWDKDWGMKGYMLMRRGVNMCGIADAATYPLV